MNTSDQSDSIRLHDLMLSHLLPKGFRRSRNDGLTHHRRKILLLSATGLVTTIASDQLLRKV